MRPPNPRHEHLVRLRRKGIESSAPFSSSSPLFVIAGQPLPPGTEHDIDPIHDSRFESRSVHSVESFDCLMLIISLATYSIHPVITDVVQLGPSRSPGSARYFVAYPPQRAEYLHGAEPSRALCILYLAVNQRSDWQPEYLGCVSQRQTPSRNRLLPLQLAIWFRIRSLPG